MFIKSKFFLEEFDVIECEDIKKDGDYTQVKFKNGSGKSVYKIDIKDSIRVIRLIDDISKLLSIAGSVGKTCIVFDASSFLVYERLDELLV